MSPPRRRDSISRHRRSGQEKDEAPPMPLPATLAGACAFIVVPQLQRAASVRSGAADHALL